MIKDIEIQNFRCFDHIKVSGFEKVNLISGKNNVGKTALLEAVYLNSSPSSNAIHYLRELRNESEVFSKAFPERTWNNFFFQQDKSSQILITTNSDKREPRKLEMFVDDSMKAFVDDIHLQNFYQSDSKSKEYFISILFPGSESRPSVMHLKASTIQEKSWETVIVSSAGGIVGKDPSYSDTQSAVTLFFYPISRYSSQDLTSEFDKARLNDRDERVLQALRTIDPSIVEVESFSIGVPTIYLRRNGENRLPLSLFGDAINRIAEIILFLVNNENSILLIDEIENGIHHSNQVSFWNYLYKLANELNVQIFATTHSLEMTQAFIEAGRQQQGIAAHFELTRQARTNKLVAIRRDLDTLEYGISHNKEVRGE